MSDEELQDLVRKKLLGKSASDSIKQRVVSIDEANRYLENGRKFAAKLSGDKVIIKMNSAGSQFEQILATRCLNRDFSTNLLVKTYHISLARVRNSPRATMTPC